MLGKAQRAIALPAPMNGIFRPTRRALGIWTAGAARRSIHINVAASGPKSLRRELHQGGGAYPIR